jgi:4-hydroxyacetophenone monooxygenase
MKLGDVAKAALAASSDAQEDAFARAVQLANIPSLLPMLVQLTGELRWLDAPYQPKRLSGVGDNDSGGLAPQIASEIRRAALEAILAHKRGKPAAIPHPSAELCIRMLECAMGESIPADYAPLVKAHLPDTPKLPTEMLPCPEGFRVLIVGAGISGIGLAVHLKHAGVPFEIIDKSSEPGGVWMDNRYPGCGVDTPNHIYAFSFAPNDWSMYFALRDEIKRYLDGLLDRYDLRSSIQLESQVEKATFDSACSEWLVTVLRKDGSREVKRANILISGVGAFAAPKRPNIPGLETFEGTCAHTARWPGCLSTAGKRVAMIGNGASAMQVGPEIYKSVASLTIFQREPQWVAPTNQFRTRILEPVRFLLREMPYYRAWYRLRLAWTFGDRLHPTLQKDATWPHPARSLNRVNDSHRVFFTQYIQSQLFERPDLLEKSLPAYPPYGKRMLMDNGWYQMLLDPRVTLVTDPVAAIARDRLITRSGAEYPADVLILATGFDMRWLTTYSLIGRSGRSIRETWNDIDARAYLGTSIPDFPNFICLYGPNLQLGHGGSYIEILEMQINYVMDMLRQMTTRSIKEFECRPAVFEAYDRELTDAQNNMVWTHPGMSTYYRNKNGRVTVNSPLRMADLFKRLSHVNLDDYEIRYA